MSQLKVSPFIDDAAQRQLAPQYPYLVVRIHSAVYQREEIQLLTGEPAAHIWCKSSFARHPELSQDSREFPLQARTLLLNTVLEAVRQRRFRMCVVWAKGESTFVEADGSFNASNDPPSGGLTMPSVAFDVVKLVGTTDNCSQDNH